MIIGPLWAFQEEVNTLFHKGTARGASSIHHLGPLTTLRGQAVLQLRCERTS